MDKTAILESREILVGSFVAAINLIIASASLYINKKVKKNTDAIDNAVNHVEPGQPTLSKRVDRINEDFVVVQYDIQQLKISFADIEQKLDSIPEAFETKFAQAQATIETLMQLHTKQSAQLDEVIKKLPKRKDDLEDKAPNQE